MQVLSYSKIVLLGRNTKFSILRKLRKQQCGMWVHISHSLAVKTTLVVQRQTAQICKIKQWLGSERKQDRDFAILLCQSLSAIAYLYFSYVILFKKCYSKQSGCSGVLMMKMRSFALNLSVTEAKGWSSFFEIDFIHYLVSLQSL